MRGSGTGTQILLTPGSGNSVAILTTTDGNLFTPTSITVTDPSTSTAAPSGFARLGNAWGVSNTFWAKASGALLRHADFDLTTGAGSILHAYSFTNANTVPNVVTAIAVDTNKNLLAGLAIETPDNVRLYDISNLESGPVLLDQELFSVKNANGNLTGAAAFGDGWLFVLDSNNGIKAFAISTNTAVVPFRITAISLQSGPAAVFTWESVAGQSYQVQSKDFLSDASWTDLGAVLATSTSASFTNAVSTTNRFYRIRAD